MKVTLRDLPVQLHGKTENITPEDIDPSPPMNSWWPIKRDDQYVERPITEEEKKSDIEKSKESPAQAKKKAIVAKTKEKADGLASNHEAV
jgi:hypothetical protein